MDYGFDLKNVAPQIHGLIQGLLTPEPQEDKIPQPLPLLTEQSVKSEQLPPEPQEQIGGTEMVNRAVAPALSQTPNSLALGIKRDILAEKQNYNVAKTDEQRAAAQAKAGLLRDIAQSSGIDLSGYGSDDSYDAAYKNLYTQQTKDLMEALAGKYSKTSKQYYNDTYIDLLKNGYSPRQSRKFAAALADSYQSDRVQYLDGLLNSYGRDGYVTNDIGTRAIGAMGVEGSPLANFYATIYPNAKDAYSRMNTLEDKGIDQQNQLEQLAVGHKYGLENIDAQTAGNIKYGQAQAGWQKERDERQQEYTEKNAYDQYRFSTWLARNQGKINAELAELNGAITYQNQTKLEELKHKLGIETKEYDFLLNDKKFQQNIAQYSALADYFGHEGERKRIFMEAVLGIKMPDQNTGKFDKASVDSGKKLHDMLDADEKNILEQMKNGGFDLSEQQLSQLQGKLADIREFKQRLEDTMGDQLEIEASTSRQDIPPFTGKEDQDLKTLSEMLRYMSEQNLSNDDIYYYVRQWVPQDRTDLYVEGLIRKARGS